MVDGKRNGAALATMLQNDEVPAILEQLAADGFIMSLETAAPAPKAEAPADDDKRFEMAQTYMLNTVSAFLGVFGSGLAEKVEETATLAELRALYPLWRDSIRGTPDGRKQLEELERRLAALLS